MTELFGRSLVVRRLLISSAASSLQRPCGVEGHRAGSATCETDQVSGAMAVAPASMDEATTLEAAGRAWERHRLSSRSGRQDEEQEKNQCREQHGRDQVPGDARLKGNTGTRSERTDIASPEGNIAADIRDCGAPGPTGRRSTASNGLRRAADGFGAGWPVAPGCSPVRSGRTGR